MEETSTQHPTSKPWLLPAGAVDTHVHIFDPALGPYTSNRAYTPSSAILDQLLTFSRDISSTSHSSRLILVQPSPYGTDNSVLLQTLRQCTERGIHALGIAVVDVETVTLTELTEMHKLGVRGVRLNVQATGHSVDAEALRSSLTRTAELTKHLPGWKIQIFAPGSAWEGLAPTIRMLPIKVIADHCGGMKAPSKLCQQLECKPIQQPGFSTLIQLAKENKVLIKISGLYRSSDAAATNFADMESVVRELAVQVPDSLIWGSDWPHTGEGKDRLNRKLEDVEPFRVVDDAAILDNIRRWVGEEAWLKMMVETPQRVFE